MTGKELTPNDIGGHEPRPIRELTAEDLLQPVEVEGQTELLVTPRNLRLFAIANEYSREHTIALGQFFDTFAGHIEPAAEDREFFIPPDGTRVHDDLVFIGEAKSDAPSSRGRTWAVSPPRFASDAPAVAEELMLNAPPEQHPSITLIAHYIAALGEHGLIS